MRRRNAIPRNEREARARERARATVARMRREKLSLSPAAKAEHTDPATVRRYFGSALRQEGPRKHYRATPYDRIPRTLSILMAEGVEIVTVRDSRTASRIGEYMNAVGVYARTGDPSPLESFKGRSFRASGKTYTFVADPAVIARLGSAGVLPIEGLYREVAAP